MKQHLDQIYADMKSMFGLALESATPAGRRQIISEALGDVRLPRTRDQKVRFLTELRSRLRFNKTGFWRSPRQKEFIFALPIKKSGIERLLFVGCSTGEEVWMTSALRRMRGARVEAEAFDLNPDLIEIAKFGVYRRRDLQRRVPQARFPRNLITTPDTRHIQFHQQQGFQVKFSALDLESFLRGHSGSKYSMISFRNVGHFYSANLVQTWYSQLARSLQSNGVLLVGPRDPIPNSEQWQSVGPRSFRARYSQR